MKKLFIAIGFLTLTGCYQVTYDSTLSLRGNIVDASGNAQSFDLNESAEICVDLSLDRTLDHEYHQKGKLVTYCRVLSSDSKGNLVANFSPDSPLNSGIYPLVFGGRHVANVLSARVYIKLEDGRKIEGEVLKFKKQSQTSYSAFAQFVVNKSNYSPSKTIDVNQSRKKYTKP